MLRFESDYMEGAHPNILKRLEQNNYVKTTGYGCDEICDSAKAKIRAACGCPDGEVHFLVGGTQTNSTVIRALLRNYEAVVSVATGHIAVHEAGAVEATGHKVVTLPAHLGKMDAGELKLYLTAFYADGTYTHMPQPGMVYISQPTEYGTLYTEEELSALHRVCISYNIPLFVDGARLGYALAAEGGVDLKTLAENCDAFYIGGTKVGALFGEAVVFPRMKVPGFFTTVKQSGALLAKGWLLGIQFDELFTDELYLCLGENAVKRAMQLKRGLREKGYSLFIDSMTNQQFVVLENSRMKDLEGKVTYSIWEPLDEESTVVRFATSWATTEQQIEELLALL